DDVMAIAPHGADPRLPAVRFVLIEGDDDLLEGRPELHRHGGGPLEGDAVLRDIVELANVAAVTVRERDRDADRSEIGSLVAIGTKVDVASLSAVELGVRRDLRNVVAGLGDVGLDRELSGARDHSLGIQCGSTHGHSLSAKRGLAVSPRESYTTRSRLSRPSLRAAVARQLTRRRSHRSGAICGFRSERDRLRSRLLETPANRNGVETSTAKALSRTVRAVPRASPSSASRPANHRRKARRAPPPRTARTRERRAPTPLGLRRPRGDRRPRSECDLEDRGCD